jgi:hypothetical protein
VSRIQRYSSYTFSAFLTAHIVNISLIPLATRSLPASDTYLLLTRPYYQSPIAEPILISAPLALHIGSGIALRLYRRHQLAKRYGAESKSQRRSLSWPKLSWNSISGYALAPALAIHTLVNRIVPLWVDGGSSGVGLQYVAHGFAKHPVVANLGYFTLVGIASFHVVWGWSQWLGQTPDQSTDLGFTRTKGQKRRWWTINMVSASLAGLWMAGGLGVVGRGGRSTGWVGKGFDELYRQIPIVGGGL